MVLDGFMQLENEMEGEGRSTGVDRGWGVEWVTWRSAPREARSFESRRVMSLGGAAEKVDRPRQGLRCRMDIGEVRDGSGGLKAVKGRGGSPFS